MRFQSSFCREKTWLALSALSVMTVSAIAQAADFSLNTSQNAPLYRTELSQEVYRYSTRNGLDDLRIQNSAGESVPYALLQAYQLQAETPQTQSVPMAIFPIESQRLNNPQDLRIQLQSGNQSTTVNIGQNTPAATPAQYILDAGKDHLPLKTLTVDWQHTDNQITVVEVSASDDLQNWQPLGRTALLKSSNQGQNLLQNRVDLDNATKARYLLLRTDNQQPLRLTSAYAEYTESSAAPANIAWQPLTFKQRYDKNDVINLEYEANGRYPTTLLKIELPQDNTITNVRIAVRNSQDEPWQGLLDSAVFKLQDHNKTLNNPDIQLVETVARYWQLQFNRTGGGIGTQNPQVKLGWAPQTVVWNARGNAPFTLNVGNTSGESGNRLPVASLVPDFTIKKAQALPQATLKLNPASADTAVNVWHKPADKRRIGLWLGLFVGVMLLAGMAMSLLKNLDKSH